MVPQTANEKTPARASRWRHRLVRVGLVAFFGLVLVAGGATWLLGNLEAPWMKRWLVRSLRNATGLEIDYGKVELRILGELKVERLAVRSPERFRGIQPLLLSLGSMEIAWSPRDRWRGGPWLDRVTLRDVAIDLVADEQGRTSLSELFPSSGGPPRAQPGPPLSRLPAGIFGGTPPVGSLDVDGLSLSFTRVEGVKILDRSSLGPLALSARTTASAQGGWSLRTVVTGGEQGAFAFSREEDGHVPATARAALHLEVHGSAEALGATIDGRVLEQSLVPTPVPEDLLQASLSARFGNGRTDIDVDRLRVAGGALVGAAAAQVQDGAPAAHLSRVTLDLDLGKLEPLLYAVGLPARWRGGRLHVAGEGLRVSAGAVSGTVEIEGKVEGLAVGGTSAAAVGLSLHARPVWNPSGLSLGLDGTASAGGVVWQGGTRRIAMDDGEADVHFPDLALNLANPLATSGRGEIRLRCSSLSLRSGRALVAAGGVAATLGLRRAKQAPLNVELSVPIDRLRLVDARGRLLYEDTLRLGGQLSELAIDEADPPLSRGSGKVTLAAGPLRLSLDARSDGEKADYRLSVEGQLPPLLAATLPPPAGSPFTLSSRGQLEGLAAQSPSLDAQTTLRLQRVSWPARRLSAASIALSLSTSGTAQRQAIEAALALRDPTYAGRTLGNGRLEASARLDLPGRSARAQLRIDGDELPRGSITAGVELDPGGRKLAYELSGRLARLALAKSLLASFGPLPARPAFDDLDVTVKAHGTATGLTEMRDGVPQLSPVSWTAVSGEGEAQVDLEHLAVEGAQWSANAPQVGLRAGFHASSAGAGVSGELDVGALDARAGNHRAGVRGLTDRFDVHLTGNPLDGLGQLSNDFAAASLRQDFVPEVGPEDVSLRVTATRDGSGTVRLSRVDLRSAAGGTRASLAGAVVLGDQRHKLSLRGSLTQDLARLAGDPSVFTGRGNVDVSVRVASPDLEIFRTHGEIRIRGVDVDLPARAFSARAVAGAIPISADFSSAGGALHFLRDAETNPYSLLRFADQHPLLSDSAFLSAGSVSTPEVSIAPLYGSLRIERNQISLSQLEMGVRGGRVSGQCLFDWEGADTLVQARVRASGVLSSHGEPFDGSASIVASLRDRSIDGHAEIVRIGRRHLLDLLDTQDPEHVNPAMNRVRSALALGYPDRVRLLFDHGFASALVTLGGLGRLIHIDEVRGIPTEPIVDRIVASLGKAPEDR